MIVQIASIIVNDDMLTNTARGLYEWYQNILHSVFLIKPWICGGGAYTNQAIDQSI